MSRQPLFGAAKMDSVDLGGVRASGVAVLDLHKVAGSKLVALIDQEAARDLFDARRILDIGGTGLGEHQSRRAGLRRRRAARLAPRIGE